MLYTLAWGNADSAVWTRWLGLVQRANKIVIVNHSSTTSSPGILAACIIVHH